MSYLCTVCDNDVRNPDGLTVEIVPVFIEDARTGQKKVKGWDSRISSCGSCLERLGRPIMVMHWPYQTSTAKFEKAQEVVLLGSGPSDD